MPTCKMSTVIVPTCKMSTVIMPTVKMPNYQNANCQNADCENANCQKCRLSKCHINQHLSILPNVTDLWHFCPTVSFSVATEATIVFF